MKFTQPQSIVLTDSPKRSGSPHLEFSDLDLLRTCLTASSWKGFFTTAYLTRPPVEMIPQLFTALADTNIRPTKFKINVAHPTIYVA